MRWTSSELRGNTYSLKHGDTRAGVISPEYKAWESMRGRCTNPKYSGFKHYGGRGISVDPRWNDFSVFLSDVGRRPSPRHSLDRVDNNGNYEPGNVRWATPEEQQNNRRKTIVIEAFGQRLPLAEWSRKFGIDSDTIIKRIRRWKWTAERAVSERVSRKDAFREVVRRAGFASVSDFMRATGLSPAVVYAYASGRSQREWTIERIERALKIRA